MKKSVQETVAPDYPPLDTHFHAWTKETCLSYLSYGKPLFSYLYHKEFSTEDFIEFHPTEEQMVAAYKSLNITGMPVAWDTQTFTNDSITTSNDYVAYLCQKYPDVFVAGWACVDPHKGYWACKEVERAITQLNLIGVKFQQAGQNFRITDPEFKPLWGLINDLGVPVQLHSGYTGLGTNVPGSQGVRVEWNRPFPYMEEIATTYPRIKLFALHVGDPWTGELNGMARHMGNVFRECSGMWPRYWPEEMWYELNRRLQDKYVWGTDYPLFPVDLILNELRTLEDKKGEKGFKNDEIRQKVLWKNAIDILKDDLIRVGADLSRWGIK